MPAADDGRLVAEVHYRIMEPRLEGRDPATLLDPHREAFARLADPVYLATDIAETPNGLAVDVRYRVTEPEDVAYISACARLAWDLCGDLRGQLLDVTTGRQLGEADVWRALGVFHVLDHLRVAPLPIRPEVWVTRGMQKFGRYDHVVTGVPDGATYQVRKLMELLGAAIITGAAPRPGGRLSLADMLLGFVLPDATLAESLADTPGSAGFLQVVDVDPGTNIPGTTLTRTLKALVQRTDPAGGGQVGWSPTD